MDDTKIQDTLDEELIHTGPNPRVKRKKVFFEILKLSILALIIIAPIRYFVAQPFIVSGASMDPTLHLGEYLVIDKISTQFSEPMRGDVMIFRYPLDPGVYFVKRVVGLPRETLKITGDSVALLAEDGENFEPLIEPYISKVTSETEGTIPKDSVFTVTLADDEYYMLGDNRQFSSDSRVWGPLRKKYLIGYASMRLLPLTRIALHPGWHTF